MGWKTVSGSVKGLGFRLSTEEGLPGGTRDCGSGPPHHRLPETMDVGGAEWPAVIKAGGQEGGNQEEVQC